MNSILSFLIASLVGTAIIVNGVTLNTQNIIDETKSVVNSANLHQITTAIELYYMDNNNYPDAGDGKELINLLSADGYIKGKPFNFAIFDYQIKASGQDYELNIK